MNKNHLNPRLMAAMDPFPGFLSGSVLKLIAVVSMTIDHFAASVLYGMLSWHVIPESMEYNTLLSVYNIMRGIGRTAFPIYCFLLVEGLFHTRSRAKYLLNLVVFALISELPFDLALIVDYDMGSLNIPEVISANSEIINDHQNVFFTLAIGLAACWIMEACRERYGTGPRTILAAIPSVILSVSAADFLNTDYHGIGVMVIILFYLLHPLRVPAAASSYFALTRVSNEEWAFPAFILLLFYNGKRGFLGRLAAAKYLFYIFYPAHLIIFFLIRVWALTSL